MAGERGISTYGVYLMHTSTSNGTYGKLLDITSFPDLIPPKERIDITTLSDAMRVYIAGIGDTSEQQYGANYTPENYATVSALEGKQEYYAVWFGHNSSGEPDGHYGKFSWVGDIAAGVSGGGVNEAVGMTVTCTPSTVITYAAS